MKFTIILLALFFLTLFSCDQNSQTGTQSKSVNVITKKGCVINDLIITEAKSKNDKDIILNVPVAITFFNLNKLLGKYDGVNQDSLPEKLRRPGRQEIYKIYDINGIYHAIIQPKLDSMSINIIDTVTTKGLLSFKVEDKSYFIDKGKFNELDGVLFYNGKDKPIFWTTGVSCTPENIIECYYKNQNCP